MERDDLDYQDLLFEQRHRKQLHNRLMHLPLGHPDAGDLEDALEELEDGNEFA